MQLAREEAVEFRSVDGTALRGTLRTAPRPRAGALLVHGITVDRDEGGFYRTLAEKLDGIDATSLRFDLRGHGRSEGRYEHVTLSGVINDVGRAHGLLASRLPPGAPTFVIAASFGGGLAAHWAAASPPSPPPAGLVLLNPLFDYGKRMLFDKPYWDGGGLTPAGLGMLAGRGWLEHGEFRIGPAMLNELFWIRPQASVGSLGVPLLTVHGDADGTVPYDISRRCTEKARDSEFVTIGGADHGFVHPDDEDYAHPDTVRFRDSVLGMVVSWIGERARTAARPGAAGEPGSGGAQR